MKTNCKSLLRSASRRAGKHSPLILTIIGVAGMAGSIALAIRQTPKAQKQIAERKEELNVEKLPVKETVKTCWKTYAPVAISFATSGLCIFSGHAILSRRNTTLMAMYKLSEIGYNEFKEQAKLEVGKEAVENIESRTNKALSENQEVKKEVAKVCKKIDGLQKIYDPWSDRFFYGNIKEIEEIVSDIYSFTSDSADSCMSLNQLYEDIGIDSTEAADWLGWNVSDGTIDVYFNNARVDFNDHIPAVEMRLTPPPKVNFDISV